MVTLLTLIILVYFLLVWFQVFSGLDKDRGGMAAPEAGWV
jgi:hypothetical protein